MIKSNIITLPLIIVLMHYKSPKVTIKKRKKGHILSF